MGNEPPVQVLEVKIHYFAGNCLELPSNPAKLGTGLPV